MTSSASDLVSVIVPSFNHVGDLAEALESVAAQTYHDVELIVVDDASTDGSAAVARELLDGKVFRKRFHGRVRLEVNAENQGAHAAINRGLALASGEWLTILNSDDCYPPQRIEVLLAALREQRGAIAFTEVEFIGTDSRPVDPRHVDAFRLRGHQERIDRFPSVGFACMCSNVALTTGNLLFSRALWLRNGEFAALRYCHDWDFLLRAVEHTEPIFVRRALYRYRLHERNAFRQLGAVAEEETRVVLTRYFEAAGGGRAENELAPSEVNWPGVFEYVMDRHGFWQYWRGPIRARMWSEQGVARAGW